MSTGTAQPATSLPVSDPLIGEIYRILANLDDSVMGLSAYQLSLYLKAAGRRYSVEQIRRALREMADNGLVERRRAPHDARRLLFHLPGRGIYQGALFEGTVRRDELEREERTGLDLWSADEAAREDLSFSVMESIARGHVQEESHARQVREHAEEISLQDPVALLEQLVAWVAEDLNRLADRAFRSLEHDSDEGRRRVRELGFRRAKAESFFHRLLRLDRSVQGIPGILDIPTVPEMRRGARVVFNISRLRTRLRERVHGRQVVEILSVRDNSHRAAVGTDASVGDVYLSHARGSFIPPTPATLFVAAGAMRVRHISGNRDGYWDYDLDPRDLDRYRDLDAAMEGLFISPYLRREVITDFRHLRSAAMELRQYRQEERVLTHMAQWHPIAGVPELRQPPPTTLLIRDGRIFPLVHRLDDYEGASAPDDILYGEVVRREITTFQRVFHLTAGMKGAGPVYAGAVKFPEYSWLSMLVFWFLHCRGVQGIPADAFYRPPLTDQAVVHLLFWGLAEVRPEVLAEKASVFVTFRLLRRFSDIAFFPHPLVIVGDGRRTSELLDESRWDHWERYIEQHIREADERYRMHRRGLPALESVEEYAPFLHLCRNAGVAMCYGAPTRLYAATVRDGAHFLLPRWELAVDLTGDGPARVLHRDLARLFEWLCEEDGMMRDEEHAGGGFEEADPGLPLLIPDVVVEAHRTVGYARDRHTDDARQMLEEMVAYLRRRMEDTT